MKNSTCKCVDTASFLGKINQNISAFTINEIVSELNQKYKQFTFEPEDNQKPYLKYDILKIMKHIRESNKVSRC